MNREIGVVKFMHPTGYGFIQRASGADVYFHASQCGTLWQRGKDPILVKDQHVSFTVGRSVKGTDEAKQIEAADQEA